MITSLDYVVLALYFAGLVGLSVFIGWRFADREDYFLSGRRMPAWAVAGSIMATQAGVISMISAPAFVAVRPEGGLIWLQYEFAIPLAMILIMAVLAPQFSRAGVISVYEYLERRFDARTRAAFSGIFQISRALATGVSIYTAGILISVILDTPLWISILLMGLIALCYTTIGGIAADIWSDVIQLVILWAGIFVVLGFAISAGGGWTAVVSEIPLERFHAVNFVAHGLGDGQTYSFWPMVIGGFFLYASYYGCDQSQVQRVLSAPSIERSRRALWYNGLLRFPLVLSYTLVGLVMAGFVVQQPEFTALIPQDKLDYMLPLFIKHYVPTGLTGLILAAMFAAVMSSIDSAFNSLAAASIQDVYARHIRPAASDRHYLVVSRAATVFWGVVCTAFAFLVGGAAPTVIEGINKIGSVFYGPILAAFLMATLSRRAIASGVLVGLVAGVGVNLILWLGFEEAVSWLWWNAIGCLVTTVVAYAVSLAGPLPTPAQLEGLVLDRRTWLRALRERAGRYAALALYFAAIVLVSWALWYLHIPLPVE